MESGLASISEGSAYQDEVTLVSELSVGVVGCGYWGPKLVRNFRDLPGARLEQVSDLREERLEEIKNLYPEVKTTTNFYDLLGDEIDALVVATPVHTHYPIVKAALLAGKHVLVEKPITSRSEQAEELVDLASKQGVTLMVGHTFVFNPAVQAVRNVIQAGQLGSVYYINSTRANLGLLQPDINVMWDLAPHDISILRYILNMDPVTVSARGAVYVNTFKKLHEVVYMTLFFEGDLMANLRLSWLDPVKQRRLTVVGSEKMLVYDDIADDKVVLFDKGVEVPPYSITEDEFRASYRHGEESIYPFEWEEPLRAECSHFIDCVRTGMVSLSSGVEGVKVLRVLETAQRSLINGGVELKIEY
jgi:predicted dehydrogenase